MRGRGYPIGAQSSEKQFLRHKRVIQLYNCNFYYILMIGVNGYIIFQKKNYKNRLFEVCPPMRGRGYPIGALSSEKQFLRHKRVIQLYNCKFYYILEIGVTTYVIFKKNKLQKSII